jgi:hypothetical protein
VPGDFAQRIVARLLSPPLSIQLDEEIFLMGERSHVHEYLFRLLEDLQLKLHDQMRDQIQKNDIRQRGFVLSKEEKSLLHKMYMEAVKSLHAPFAYNDDQYNAREDERRKYEALVGKLLR